MLTALACSRLGSSVRALSATRKIFGCRDIPMHLCWFGVGTLSKQHVPPWVGIWANLIAKSQRSDGVSCHALANWEDTQVDWCVGVQESAATWLVTWFG